MHIGDTWQIRLQGYPKLVNQSQPLVSRRSPYCGDMCRTYCCLTSFFPIVDMCLSFEDIARQSCAMVPRWRFLATFCVLCFQRAACSRFQTCILIRTKATPCVEVWQTSNLRRFRLGEEKRRKKNK